MARVQFIPKTTVVKGYAPCAGITHDNFPCSLFAMRDYPFVGHAPRCWHHEAQYNIKAKRAELAKSDVPEFVHVVK